MTNEQIIKGTLELGVTSEISLFHGVILTKMDFHKILANYWQWEIEAESTDFQSSILYLSRTIPIAAIKFTASTEKILASFHLSKRMIPAIGP